MNPAVKTCLLRPLLLRGSLLSAVLLPVVLLLNACTMSEVAMTEVDVIEQTPEAAAAEAAKPDTSLRLPSLSLMARSATDIASLTPDQADKRISIAGTVTQRSALLEGWVYQVQDDSGSLWVLSDASAPAVGETATVEGVLRYESIMVDGMDASDLYLQAQ